MSQIQAKELSSAVWHLSTNVAVVRLPDSFFDPCNIFISNNRCGLPYHSHNEFLHRFGFCYLAKKVRSVVNNLHMTSCHTQAHMLCRTVWHLSTNLTLARLPDSFFDPCNIFISNNRCCLSYYSHNMFLHCSGFCYFAKKVRSRVDNLQPYLLQLSITLKPSTA
jgi:hypothetical protein